MGSNPRAHLAYGYDLGTSEDFKAEQRDEYDQPDLPWFDVEGGDFVEAAERVLLTSVGFTETDWRADGYYERQRAAEAATGVEFQQSGHPDYPGWVLVARGSERSVEWAETMPLDLKELGDAPVTGGWDSALGAALAVLGITPTQDRACWLVFPSYG